MNWINVDCNVCGSKRKEKFLEYKPFTLKRCLDCGFIYTDPQLDENDLVKVYNNGYYKNSKFYDSEQTHYGYENYFDDKENIQDLYKKILDKIEKFTIGQGNLLDIGCAYGFFLELVKNNGWNIFGTELNNDAYKYCVSKGYNVYNKPFLECDFRHNFDVITMFGVLEHLPKPKDMLIEISRMLNRSGLLVVSTPNTESLVAKVLGKNWLEYKRVREHISFFSKKLLTQLLHELGYEVIYTNYKGRNFKLSHALQWLELFNKNFSVLKQASIKVGLGDVKININPMWNMVLYARKV